jgi:hypothetical protein
VDGGSRWAVAQSFASGNTYDSMDNARTDLIVKLKSVGAPGQCTIAQGIGKRCSNPGAKCFVFNESDSVVMGTSNHGDINEYGYIARGTVNICD